MKPFSERVDNPDAQGGADAAMLKLVADFDGQLRDVRDRHDHVPGDSYERSVALVDGGEGLVRDVVDVGQIVELAGRQDGLGDINRRQRDSSLRRWNRESRPSRSSRVSGRKRRRVPSSVQHQLVARRPASSRDTPAPDIGRLTKFVHRAEKTSALRCSFQRRRPPLREERQLARDVLTAAVQGGS